MNSRTVTDGAPAPTSSLRVEDLLSTTVARPIAWFLVVCVLISCAQDREPVNIDLQLISIEVTHEKPAKGACEEMGPVVGIAYGKKDKAYQMALRDLKIHTLQEGANRVRILSFVKKGQILKGIAYKCKPPEPEEEPAPEAS